MAYKLKPNKGIKKRFKITKTGKVKRHHAYHSHLMSGRPAAQRRRSRGSAIMDETIGRNIRKMAGCSHLNPNKLRHDNEVAAKQAAKAESAPSA